MAAKRKEKTSMSTVVRSKVVFQREMIYNI